MRFWLKIGTSLFLIFISLTIIWLLKAQQIRAASTANLVFITGSYFGLITGIILLLLTFYIAGKEEIERKIKRKTERLTQDDIRRRLEEGIEGEKPEYIEAKLITRAGSIASYLKKRGVSKGRLTERGMYLTYENWAQATKTTVEDILRKYPNLRKESYLLDILSRIDVFYLSELMEKFSYFYEESRKQRFPYLQKRHLRALTSLMKRHVKR